MRFLHWLGGIVVFFWVLGFVLRIGGGFIHLLLIAAVVVFLFEFIFGKRR